MFCELNLFDALKANIRKTEVCNSAIPIKCNFGRNWEENVTYLKQEVEQWQFGLIFADQFSTELDLNLFLETVRNNKLIDVLVFFNQQTLSRFKGKGKTKREILFKIAKALGVSVEEVEAVSKEEFKDFVIRILRDKFFDLKGLSAIAALPIEVKRGNQKILQNADYFYLVLSTGSPHVLDAFISKYDEITGNTGRLLEYYDLKEKIMEILNIAQARFFEDALPLSVIYSIIAGEFLSWKGTNKGLQIVPTLEKLVEAINMLKREEKISIRADENYLYKRPAGRRGELNANKLTSKKAFTEVWIVKR